MPQRLSQPARLAHIIFDNWLAKIIAILLAFGLWAFVVNTGYRSAVLPESIPVTVRDVPQTLAVASELPNVQVEVFAPTASFQRLKAADLQAFVNGAGLTAGTHTVEIKVFADDPNVRILSVTPAVLELTLEKKTTDTFDLKLETDGSLGQGYVADKAELSPDKVEVTGASSVIAQIDQVVVRLPLNGETSTVERTLTPVAFDKDRQEITNLSFEPATVDVKVPVIQAEDAKSVGIKVETTGEPAEGFFVGTITTDPSTATAQGSSKALRDITTLSTEPIDLSGATEKIERTVKLDTPDNVRAEPASIKVTIEIRAGSLTRRVSASVTTSNVESGLSASVSPNKIELILTGPADKVRAAAANALTVTIDMSGKDQGDYGTTLLRSMLNLDSAIEVEFNPRQVTVTLD
ncbi:MAG: CdaR family protein [Candidatus Andersenbacteria bacterium]